MVNQAKPTALGNTYKTKRTKCRSYESNLHLFQRAGLEAREPLFQSPRGARREKQEPASQLFRLRIRELIWKHLDKVANNGQTLGLIRRGIISLQVPLMSCKRPVGLRTGINREPQSGEVSKGSVAKRGNSREQSQAF